MGELPKIISVDDHVVEPRASVADVAAGEVPGAGAAGRSGVASGAMRHIGGGVYEQTFDPDGPQADCWVYEDLVYVNKRHVAAVGFDRDDMTMSPITYDEMRPGCYDPKARVEGHGAELGRGVAAASRRSRGSAARRSSRPRTASSALGVRQGLQRLDGRGVVRRLAAAASSRCASCRCGTPSSRPRRSAATPRAACARCASARSRRTSGCRRSTAATGTRSSRRATRPAPSLCMHIGSSSRMPATSPDAPAAVAATLALQQLDGVAGRLAVLGQAGAVPEAEARLLARARSAGSRTSSSGPTTCGSSTTPGAA